LAGGGAADRLGGHRRRRLSAAPNVCALRVAEHRPRPLDRLPAPHRSGRPPSHQPCQQGPWELPT
jgi:hypothetical protein